MPGRQSNGRPLMPTGSGGKKANKRSKFRANQKALNAFSIASDHFADRQKATPRNRELDAEKTGSRGGKHARDDDDDDDDDGDDDDEEMDAPPRKMRRSNRDDEVEYASDSSGNEWRIGVDDDDDSSINSDDAFGESDEERYENYKSSKGKKKAEDSDDEEDMDDADGASLGSDAIDLAAALDMSDSEDEDEAGDAGSESDEGSTDMSSQSDDNSSDEEEDDVSESGVNAWVSRFSGVKDSDEKEDGVPKKKPKINLEDLGLAGLKDPQLKKSVKMLGKEEKSDKTQKLDVPLASRQQARLDRDVAYDKTKETLDRWNDTVKQNRRADHLVFPLPQNVSGIERHDNTEIQPLDQKKPGNELESTIMAIMEESGLGPSAQKKAKSTDNGDELEGQTLSQGDLKALWGDKRRQRELKSQEDKRAKRIKKIKSKAYHRVHRKQKERDAIKEHDALAAAGEIDSEEEREAQDRQRAMERMGARHRESKWAKMSKKNAAWDEDVRVGLTDMARRDEELRRRIDGRPGKSNEDDDDDDESDDSGDSDTDQRQRLLRKLDNASADDDSEPRSKLLNMDFMKRAEASKKKANDDMVAQIRRDLASDDEDAAASGEETEEVGRKQFGQPSLKTPFDKPAKSGKKNKKAESGFQESEDTIMENTSSGSGLSAPASQIAVDSSGVGGAWSQPSSSGPAKKQRGKKNTSSAAEVLDLGMDSVAVAPEAAAIVATKKPSNSNKPQKKGGKQQSAAMLARANDVDTSSEDEDDDDHHMPVRFREQELLDKAFGGLDVVADFEREKADIAEEDDDKEVDKTLPGWGGWVGEGVSAREKKRHHGRFVTKQEGVKRKADRRDAKLKDAILNEKRTKKTEKYLASQLPHPFESRLQYERSLRLPVGPEWMTKETIQETTKPRVMVKQGHIIAPMSRPS